MLVVVGRRLELRQVDDSDRPSEDDRFDNPASVPGASRGAQDDDRLLWREGHFLSVAKLRRVESGGRCKSECES